MSGCCRTTFPNAARSCRGESPVIVRRINACWPKRSSEPATSRCCRTRPTNGIEGERSIMAHTKVLLREDVDDLGARGEIVRVRAGYARNYLLPRNLAVGA